MPDSRPGNGITKGLLLVLALALIAWFWASGGKIGGKPHPTPRPSTKVTQLK